jgi:hypothetical protein
MAPPKRIQVNTPQGIQNPVFSQAMIHGDLVYVSGNIGYDYRYPFPQTPCFPCSPRSPILPLHLKAFPLTTPAPKTAQ